MGLEALEFARKSPEARRDIIGALQELPEGLLIAVLELGVIRAEAFGLAQRVVVIGDEPHHLPALPHEVGGNEFRFLATSGSGLLTCRHGLCSPLLRDELFVALR
jgi:hypothetical protein